MLYGKGIHNGQYVHVNSFDPRERRATRIKALYKDGMKTCTTPELLKQEKHLQ